MARHETLVLRIVPRHAKYKVCPLARNKQGKNRVTPMLTLKSQLPTKEAL